MTLAARLRNLHRCDSGAAAVEFALVAMVAISIFVGTIEFGRTLYVRNELSYAADIAARRILTNPAVADSDLESEVRSSIVFAESEKLQLTFGTESVDGVSFRTLLMQQPLTLMIPDLSVAEINLTVSRRVPIF